GGWAGVRGGGVGGGGGGDSRPPAPGGGGTVSLLPPPMPYPPPPPTRRPAPPGDAIPPPPPPPATPRTDLQTAMGEALPERNGHVMSAEETVPETMVNEYGDDREDIRPGDRVLLIIENDIGFARFLLDAAREKGFKGLVTPLG